MSEDLSLDALCDSFEAAWKTNPDSPPSLEEFAGRCSPSDRAELLRLLIEIDIEYRRRHDRTPEMAEYQRRFPEESPAIALAFDLASQHRESRGAADVNPKKEPEREDPYQSLLLGIVAMQAGAIQEAQLAQGIQRWGERKFRDMGEVLISEGMLNRTKCKTLEMIVEAQVRLHGGNARDALGALPSIPFISHLLDIESPDPDFNSSLVVLRNQRYGAKRPLAPESAQEGGSGSRYSTIAHHAQGGLGEVYRARDCELNRIVALKEIRDEFADEPDVRDRFVQEAEITGGLEHPGIVPIYGLGCRKNGRPYYAMRLIKGESLRQAIHRLYGLGSDDSTNGAAAPRQYVDYRGVAFRKLLGHFVDACQAIGYAHSRGIIHRDIKPANLMLGKYGETLVVDWGLAKVIERANPRVEHDEETLKPTRGGAHSLTILGKAIGTPVYMPPEQADGKIEQMGVRSDVYGLGATLYHLLAGRSAFISGESDVLDKVRRGEFRSPRAIRGDIPRPLEAICLKAMSKEPDARYESTQLMAEEIEKYLADEPIQALPDSIGRKVIRFVRRRPSLAIGVGTFLVCLLTGSIWISLKNQQIAFEKRQNELMAAIWTDTVQLASPSGLGVEVSASQLIKNVENRLEEKELAVETKSHFYSVFLDHAISIGDTGNAEKYAKKLEEILANRPGELSEKSRLLAICQIASVKWAKGDVKGAIEGFEYVEKMLKEHNGESDRDYISVLQNLGMLYSLSNEQTKSELILKKVIELGRRYPASITQNAIYAKRHLSDLRISSGKREEGIALFREALGEAHERLGPNSPTTLWLTQDLGSTVHGVEGTALIAKAYDGWKSATGLESEKTELARRQFIINAGECTANEIDWVKALQITNDGKLRYEILELQRGAEKLTDEDKVARTMSEMFAIEALFQLGRDEEAEERIQTWQRHSAERGAIFGGGIRLDLQLAKAALRQGRHADAVALFDKARGMPNLTDIDRVELTYLEIENQINNGMLDQAESRLRDAYEKAVAQEGGYRGRIAKKEIIDVLCRLFERTGETEKLKEWSEKRGVKSPQ